MKKLFYCLLAGCLLLGCGDKDDPTIAPTPSTSRKCAVVLAGDSTCAAKSSSERPKYGWGEKLSLYLNTGHKVENKAVGGKSTKTFRETPISSGSTTSYWIKTMNATRKGDVVMIQFGHNDENQTASDNRGTTPDEYYDNLCFFIREVRKKDAIPVILTPICRLQYDSDGTLKHTHGSYLEMAKKAAADNQAICLDMEQITYDYLTELGQEQATLRFMISVEGSSDYTHLTELGASDVSMLTAKAMKECGDMVVSAIPQ